MKNLFNSKVTFRKVVRTQDNYGTWTESWANISGETDIACRINWFSGQRRMEYIDNGKLEWKRDARVYRGYSTGIAVDDRMVYNSKNYNIVNIADFDEMKKYMTLNIKRSS